MKTPNEILTKHLPEWHKHISFVGHEAVIKAMEEYANMKLEVQRSYIEGMEECIKDLNNELNNQTT